MALSNKISFICESCGTMQEEQGSWSEAAVANRARGWLHMSLSSGWRHFCRDCGQTITTFIADSLKQTTKAKVKAKRTDTKVGQRDRRKLKQTELLKLFNQTHDHYEELPLGEKVYVKQLNGNTQRWQVTAFTRESFSRYKLWGDLNDLDKRLDDSIARDRED